MDVGSHVSITFSCKLCSWGVWHGGGDGWFKSPTYFAIYHHLAKYTYIYYFAIKVWLNGSWFVIHNEILEFHNWIVCYHEHFQHKLRRWKSLELKMDLWHLTDMKVILTLKYWTLLKVVLLLLVLILLHLMKSNGYVHLLNILHKNLEQGRKSWYYLCQWVVVDITSIPPLIPFDVKC